MFSVQNKVMLFSPLLFNFALEYHIRKAQESEAVLQCFATRQLMFYVYGENLLGDDVNTIKIKQKIQLMLMKLDLKETQKN
jgi:hypothetical protein